MGLGDEFVRRIKSLAESTFGPRVFTAFGGLLILRGGIMGNLPRILPHGYKASLQKGNWEVPPIFSLLQREGRIPEEEMWRTFNNGIGMILVVKAEEVEGVLIRLKELGESAYLIGEISEAKKEGERVEFM